MTFDPKTISPQEIATNYLFDAKREFNSNTKRVRPGVFKPNAERKRSIYRVSSRDFEGLIPEPEIWELAKQYVEPMRGPVLGRADLSVETILSLNLQLDPNGIPHERHADIVGWPEDEEKRRFIVQELAERSTLVVKG